MLHTIRGNYESLRDTAAFAAGLDGSTAGSTFHFSDKPASAKWLGEEYNGCEIIFVAGQKSMVVSGHPQSIEDASSGLGDTTGAIDGDNFDGKLWGYTVNGPAEHICDFSAIIGTAHVDDFSTALYADTIVVTNDTHLTTVAVTDSGNNRVAKINFDTVGLSYIYCDITVGDADVVAYIRPY